MARAMGDDGAAFRAVVVVTYPAEPESDYEPHRVERRSTFYAGPYRTKGAAMTAITREQQDAKRYRGRQDWEVIGHVERAVTNWERIE